MANDRDFWSRDPRGVSNAFSQFPRSRRANGATQTFRRSSHATTLSGSTLIGSSRDGGGSQNTSTSNTGVYVPPHVHSSRNGSSVEGRYSKEQLIQLFRGQKESDDINDGLASLYVGAWEPNISNGTSNAAWGRREDPGRESQTGVDICWDRDGSIHPLGLMDMTEEEKEVCRFRPCHFEFCSPLILFLEFLNFRQFPSEASNSGSKQGKYP